MDNNFYKKNIIITGGSSGIGEALVNQLVDFGANIWIIARNEEKILQLKSRLDGKSEQVQYFSIDVQNYQDLLKISGEFKAQNIKIDGLINSAGVTYPAEFDKLDIEKYHWLMDINYFGTVNCVLAFLPLMEEGSFIVNISSMAGVLGVYGYSGYGASKYAVRGFSDVIRSELKPKKICVSVVFPPDTDTPQLAFEEKIKPAITKKIAGTANVLSASQVSKEIIKGITKRKYLIIPGFESKLLFHASNFLGPLVYPIMDLMVNQAMKDQDHNK